MADDGRLAAGDGDDLDVGQARRAQQGGHLAGTRAQVRRGGRVRGHRGDPHQPVQIGTDRGQHVPDRGREPPVPRVR